MEALLLTPADPFPESRILPVILAALVSSSDDGRAFRRYSLDVEVGVGLLPHHLPAYAALPAASSFEAPRRLCQRAVIVRDLSLSGLYFLSSLPYPVEMLLEIQLALPGIIVTLPSHVQRLDTPGRTEAGLLETRFGCGVRFIQSQIMPSSRRILMEYLIRSKH